MATVDRPSGVRVTFPETMALSDAPPPRGGTRSFREFAPPPSPSPFADDLVESLQELELNLVDEVPLHTLDAPSDPVKGRSRSAPPIPSTQTVTLDVDLDPGERAVALIEQDGIYSWSFGEVEEHAAGPSTRGRRRSAPEASATARFTVPIYASSNAQRRTRLFGVERVFRPIKAFIFKFPARFVIGQVVKQLEKDITERVVHFTGPATSDWTEITDLSTLELPGDRAPRVLLMIHGTFSSTTGAFGALGVTDFGQAFMTRAIDSYDAVLGFDHRTLSVDPLENATAILSNLRKLKSNYPIVFDAVAHSRGGLVVRSLVEHLLPTSGWNAVVRSAVFVACTNAGTALASSENWHRLIDLYTNLAIGAIKGLSLVAPQTVPTNTILGGLIKGVGVFVKALASTALDETQALGIAAMSPSGTFVSEINKTQPGQPEPDTIDYYAITSDFEASKADEDSLPAKLVKALADGAVDQLMGEINDLVVDVESMTSVDPHVDGFVKDILDYGPNGLVHHSNYFHHEGTGKALTRWLNIAEPSAAALGGVPDRHGGLVAAALPPYVEDDVLVVPGEWTGTQLKELLEGAYPEFVVVRRRDPSGQVYHYAYRPDELTVASEAEVTLEEALQLGESLSSPTDGSTAITGYASGPVDPQHPQKARIVVISSGQPVGVVPHRDELRTAGAPPTTAMRPPPPAHAPAPPHVARRGGGAMSAPVVADGAGPIDQPEKARHYFGAQMPHDVVIDEVATVEVTVSRGDIAIAASRAAGTGSAEVDTDRALILDIRPRTGFETVDQGRAEIEPLKPDDPETVLFFDVRATDVGPGEIDVVIRQGQVPLVTLHMEPMVVPTLGGGIRRQVSVEARVADAPRLKAPINELTIWEQMSHGETRLHFMFRAPGLNVRESADSDPIPGGVETYVAQVYEDIEQRWGSRKHTPDTFTKDLQAIGMGMFQRLVPDKIQRLLWKHRKELIGIQVLSDEPFVPWEIVHLKGDGATTREEWFLGQMGLVRWLENLENNGFGPEHVVIQKALAIIPDYPAGTDWELKEPSQEFAYLQQKVGAERLPSTRISVDAILENPGSFDLLHYAGHGEAPTNGGLDASLILGVEAGDGRWLTEALDPETVAQFANLATDGQRPMVVLNACQVGRMQRRLGGTGGFAKAFLSRGAGVFVSSLWAVGDEPARQFVETLYDSLHSGDMVSEAVARARQAARQGGDFTWLAYTVYANPHATVSFG